MYSPAAYAIDNPALLHDVMRERRFATLAAVIDGRVRFAYAPVVVDPGPPPFGSIRFHLARANPMSEIGGTSVHLSFVAADAYISPDWYETRGLVPTWNYIAIEGEGGATRLSEAPLRQLLVDLSAAAEQKLRPKTPWTIDRIPPDRWTALINAIHGFSVVLERLEGKFKLSQDKKPADIDSVIAALESRGDAASLAAASAMRAARPLKLTAP